MGLKVSNNGQSVLASAITASATTLLLPSGHGARFPALNAAGDWFPLALNYGDDLEVVWAYERSGDSLTVLRGQEDTAAVPFIANARVELRLTKAAIVELQDNATSLLPPGSGPIPWSRRTVPAGWILCDGRVLLPDTPYSALRAAYIEDEFPYGQDGDGNPLIPDMRGRVPAGIDNMGGETAWRITEERAEIDGTVLGAAGGWEGQTLSAEQMPAHTHGVNDPTHAHSVYDPTHAHGVYDPGHAHGYDRWTNNQGSAANTGGSIGNNGNVTGGAATGIGIQGAATGIAIYGAGTGISLQSAGAGWEHSIVQPTMMFNYIVKT